MSEMVRMMGWGVCKGGVVDGCIISGCREERG